MFRAKLTSIAEGPDLERLHKRGIGIVAFNGEYLIKLGTYKFPLEYIEAQSYVGKLITQDVDSYATADGKLKRHVIPHQPVSVSFNLIDGLTSTTLAQIMSSMRKNYITTVQEKKMNASVYISELDDYVKQDVYLKSDIDFPIDYIDSNIIVYNPINLIFTGY